MKKGFLFIFLCFMVCFTANTFTAWGYNMCTTTSVTATSGNIYDSGGPAGSYTDNENCTLLVDPGCAVSITLTFSAFALESGFDYLRVYNGTTTASPLLLNASGSSIPSPVTASSGKMLLLFTSDGSVTMSGFSASFTSTVASTPPVANFSMSTNNPPLNSAVSFTDLTSNFPSSWLWSFGDATTSTQQNPSHTYTASGVYTVTLIATNCYSSDTVSYTLSVQGAPVASVTPISIAATALCGDSVSVPLTLYNSGSGDLVYDVMGGTGGTVEVLALTYGVDLTTEYPNTINAINQYFPNYNLTAINTTNASTLQAALVGKDVFLVAEQETGSASVFTSFASVLQSFVSNGGTVIMMGTSNGSSQYIFNSGLFTGTYQGGISSGSMNVLNNTHPITSGLPATISAFSFTVYLNLTNADVVTLVSYSGYDVVAYRPIGSGNAVYIGYDYYAYDSSAAKIAAHAVQWGGGATMPVWISATPVSGTVTASDSAIITILLDASGLLAGTYNVSLQITTNDAFADTIVIPCTFTVTGQPLISLPTNTISFGSLMVGLSKTDSITVNNNGCDTLVISSVVSSSAAFTVSPGSLNVAPYGSAKIFVTFSPSAITAYSDSLIIYNNDSNRTVYLTGTGLPAPVISVNPDSFNITLLCGDSMNDVMTIYNSGGSNLTYNIIGSSTTPGNALFYDNFETGNYSQWTVASTCSTVTYSVTTVSPGQGSYSLRMDNSCGSHYNGLKKNFGTSTPDYVSFRVKKNSTTTNGAYFVIGENPALSTNNQMAFFLMNNSGQMALAGPNIYVPYVANQWYRIEFKNINYTTRKFDYYVDGVLNTAAVSFRGTNTSNNEVHIYNLTTTGITSYYDEIIISNGIPALDWVGYSPVSGTVTPGDSSIINLNFNAAGLLAGQYTGNIIVVTNDPANDSVFVPCTLNVTGQPLIALSTNTINFGSLMVGLSKTDSITVNNNGCDSLVISSVVSSSAAFTVSPGSLNVAPYGSAKMFITFTPSAAMAYSDSLIIYNNDSDRTVYLTGTGLPAPVISVNPDSFNITLLCGDSMNDVMTIYNSGGSNLTYNIIGSSTTPGNALFYDNFETGNYSQWTVASTCSTVTYSVTTVSPGQGSYSLRMDNSCGSHYNGLKKNFGTSTPDYVSFRVKKNSTTTNGAYFVIGENPALSTTNQMAFFYMNSSGQMALAGPNIYVPYVANQWYRIEFKNINYTTRKFDYYIDGVLNTTAVSFRGTNTSNNEVHIYNLTTTGITSYYDEIIISNGIPALDWVGYSPVSGTVTPGDSSIINLNFNAAGLLVGQYTGNIIVVTNDPANDSVFVPCTLNVTGQPLIALSTNTINFGSVLVGDTKTDSVIISNTGCATLTVNNIVSSDADFTPALFSFSLLPDSSKTLVLNFIPSTVAAYSDSMVVYNNASNEVIYLNGTGMPAPEISVSPTSYNITLSGCGDSASMPLVIYNNGLGDLYYNIGGTGSSGTVEVLALTYGVDLTTEYPNTISAISQYFPNYNLTEINTTSASTLQTALAGKDVFLVPEQETGTASVFTSFASVLQSFVTNGGTVIMLGTSNSNSQYIFNSGLFSGTYQSSISSGTMNVLNNTHPITTGLASTMNALNLTVTLNISNGDAVTLVAYTGYDVVTYRPIGSGNAVYIGFDYYAYDSSAAEIIAHAVQWGGGSSMTSWISVSGTSDTVPYGGSSSQVVVFDATGLNGGTYTGNIIISSNDPSNPEVWIPCTLNVSYMPCAGFSISNFSACNGSVTFQDESTNSPTSWNWDFGDGNTSTQQNPTHVYPVNGTFPVQLIVCNGFGCDTIVENVTVLASGSPAAACSVTTTAYCCGMGIYNVNFNSINNTTVNGGSDGYKDYTCTSSTTVSRGQTYSITVQTGASYYESVRAWIDFNNNATFDASELVFDSYNKLVNHSGTVTVPLTAVINAALRMRVTSDYYSSATPAPCTNVTYGQTEDYTVVVIPDAVPPVAAYIYSIPSGCSGTILFTDSSGNNPTTWYWDFGDGNISTGQNPSHTYSATGAFTVALTVCNAYGCDSISQTVTVNSIGTVTAACTPVTTTYCCSMGIYNVNFSAINNSSGNGSEGYKDFSCTIATTVVIGQTYTLYVQTGSSVNENVRGWIDYNNNGTFEITEQVLVSNNKLINHSASVTIPSTALINIPLRLRVGSDYYSEPVPSPCTNVKYGQFEDYAVTVVPSTIPPDANFSFSVTDTCGGEVEFSDSSVYNPTAWLWDFGDGDTSGLQNPTHIYSAPGSYSVILVSSNSYGSDTFTTSVTVDPLFASFTITGSPAPDSSLTFTGTSAGATAWSWDFGDGYTASVQSPVHAYSDTGTFTVTFTVTNASGCTAQTTQVVVIAITGIGVVSGISRGDLVVKPNPSGGIFSLLFEQNNAMAFEIRITNAEGQTVYMEKSAGISKYQKTFDFSGSGSGEYNILLSAPGLRQLKKVIIH